MGWGIIDQQGSSLSFVAAGTCSPKPKQPMAERLFQLHEEVERIKALHAPHVAAIEETFVNVNAASTLKLGNARGAIMLSLAISGLAVHEYAARLVKKTVVGSGRAEKGQIEMMVNVLLPATRQQKLSADAYDALAIAICHANHS
jgi:crossover junction endodeoxyribonuclease RuvC